MIKCAACDFEYVFKAGHCCSDSETTTELRIKLAEEISKNKELVEAKAFILTLRALLDSQNKRLFQAAHDRNWLLANSNPKEQRMKIISRSFTTTSKKFTREFSYAEFPNRGASFPCNEEGEVDESKLDPVGLENFRECLSGKGETIINQEYERVDGEYADYIPIPGTGIKVNITIIDLGIKVWEKTTRTPAVGACDRCARPVSLSNFTNYCSCGAMYSIGGGRLHDNPAEWVDGTNDHPADLLRI